MLYILTRARAAKSNIEARCHSSLGSLYQTPIQFHGSLPCRVYNYDSEHSSSTHMSE